MHSHKKLANSNIDFEVLEKRKMVDRERGVWEGRERKTRLGG